MQPTQGCNSKEIAGECARNRPPLDIDTNDHAASNVPYNASSPPDSSNLSASTDGSSSSSTAPPVSDTIMPVRIAEGDLTTNSLPLSPKGHRQPETTIIELTSASATSSAFPESFGLTISREGTWTAAYSSTALYILRSRDLPEVKARAFRLRRKPLAVAIADGNATFALLTDVHKAEVYKCEGDADRYWDQNYKFKSVFLDNDTTTIALSPDGSVLAAGSRSGIEVVSLAADAAENDRRVIVCQAMTELCFSDDGLTLLATSATRRNRASTIISVGGTLDGPIMEEEGPELERQPPHKAWIRQVNELFAFSKDSESWGLYDITAKNFFQKKRAIPEALRRTRIDTWEDALPAVSIKYNHVATAIKRQGCSEIYLYRLPHDWQIGDWKYQNDAEHGSDSSTSQPCVRVQLLRDDENSAENITGLRWLDCASHNRLIALGHTGGAHAVHEDLGAGLPPATSGRIILIDFDWSSTKTSDRIPHICTIDLDTIPQEDLADEQMDFEREVAIVRRRTLMRRTNSVASVESRHNLRSSSFRSRRSSARAGSDSRSPRPRRRSSMSSMNSEDTDYGPVPTDEPYSQGAPRSQFSLNRAATVAANAPVNRRHLLALPDRPLEYRRADGLREIPHESDADNWVPPPPPYT
ncbi:hypothetical protein K402DRAFT_370192, partial [Aulographum hederae CBS 113979]